MQRTTDTDLQNKNAQSNRDVQPEIHDIETGLAESSNENFASESESEVTPPTVLVGVPAYNESQSIASVVTDVKAHADEVLVVDDGSNDETSERAREAGATVITHETNMGYGSALNTIFRHAHARNVKHLVTVDGDGQHNPEDIPKLIKSQQLTGADIVIGSRFIDRSDLDIPIYRKGGLAVVNTLTNVGLWLYSSSGISDTQSGFRAYRRSAVETMLLAEEIGTGMGASLDILFHAARESQEIEEVPTTIQYDVAGANSKNPIIHGLGLLWAILCEVIPTGSRRLSAAISLTGMFLAAAVQLW